MTETGTEKILQDLRVLASDAEALLAATADQAGARVSQARSQAEATLRKVRERMSALENEVGAKIREGAKATDAYVRENPWRAVGIAAGAGLLVGLLLASRR
jgi:ElaB/YqjD/DUF883 family membrane-anchored ribosome-binding protein